MLLGNNHQYLLLCEGKYHPPVLFKTRHGSYRKMFQKLVQAQLSLGQVVLLLPLPPSDSRVTQAVRHALRAGHLLPMRGTKCPQYSWTYTPVKLVTQQGNFNSHFVFSSATSFLLKKKGLGLTSLCSAPTPFHSGAVSIKQHFVYTLPLCCCFLK